MTFSTSKISEPAIKTLTTSRTYGANPSAQKFITESFSNPGKVRGWMSRRPST